MGVYIGLSFYENMTKQCFVNYLKLFSFSIASYFALFAKASRKDIKSASGYVSKYFG